MKSTGYRNPEGLTAPGHTTTARDLSILATRLLMRFPLEYVGYYAIKHYRYPGTLAANDSNRNLLLFRDPTVDGLKTGHRCGPAAPPGGDRQARDGQCRPAPPAQRDAGHRERTRAPPKARSCSTGATPPTSRCACSNGQQAVGRHAAGLEGQASVVKLGRPEGVIVTVPGRRGRQAQDPGAASRPLLAPLQQGQAVGALRVTNAASVIVADKPPLVLETVEGPGHRSRLGRAAALDQVRPPAVGGWRTPFAFCRPACYSSGLSELSEGDSCFRNLFNFKTFRDVSMPTINQLIRPRAEVEVTKSKSPRDGKLPQRRGVCTPRLPRPRRSRTRRCVRSPRCV